jgi:hypothetical protein
VSSWPTMKQNAAAATCSMRTSSRATRLDSKRSKRRPRHSLGRDRGGIRALSRSDRKRRRCLCQGGSGHRNLRHGSYAARARI